MAEATLNDVTNAIREDGNNSRAQTKFESLRRFFQVRNSNKLLKSLTQAQIDSNKQMKKQFEQEQEALRRANAKKTLAEPANDNETRFQRIISGLIAGVESTINVLERIKKALPNKKTAFGLLFGGLAAAFAFFPEWSKRNLINPLIDVINVFQGKDYTTTLGRVVQNLKEGLGWISDNFGEEAAWVTGILTTVAALHPITTLKVLSGSLKGLTTLGSFLGLPVIGAIGGLVIAAGALLLAKEGLDYLRNLNIEDEVKNIQEKKSALISALASGNVDDIKTAKIELRETLTRMKNTGLDESAKIQKEMLAAMKILAKEAERRQKDALNKINEMGELAARDAETMAAVRGIKEGAGEAFRSTNDPVQTAMAEFAKIDALNISQEDKNSLISIIQGAARKFTTRDERSKISLLAANMTGNRANSSETDDMSILGNFSKTREDMQERSLKETARAAQVAQNRAIQLAGTARGGFGEMDANIIAAPVTNNNDNKKTVNNVYYNVFTDSNLNPSNGRYENGVLPSYM